MTISKERLNEIALEVAEELPCCMNHISFDTGVIWDKQEIIEFAHALMKRVESECEVTYYEYRTWYGENTVNPGWGEWTRVVPRDCRCTVEDAVVEIGQYISAGYKYELRELIALPLVEGD